METFIEVIVFRVIAIVASSSYSYLEHFPIHSFLFFSTNTSISQFHSFSYLFIHSFIHFRSHCSSAHPATSSHSSTAVSSPSHFRTPPQSSLPPRSIRQFHVSTSHKRQFNQEIEVRHHLPHRLVALPAVSQRFHHFL